MLRRWFGAFSRRAHDDAHTVSGLAISVNAPAPAQDGFHHPASEQELVDLVKAAYREGRLLRVRGAAHSGSDAVYTGPQGPNRVSRQSPPADGNINVMLDRYRGWHVKDEARKLVEAERGSISAPIRAIRPEPPRWRRACSRSSRPRSSGRSTTRAA